MPQHPECNGHFYDGMESFIGMRPYTSALPLRLIGLYVLVVKNVEAMDIWRPLVI